MVAPKNERKFAKFAKDVPVSPILATRYSTERERLRRAFDPQSVWLSDIELDRVLVVTNGRMEMAVRRCLLGILQKAQLRKNKAAIVKVRADITRFEAGLLEY